MGVGSGENGKEGRLWMGSIRKPGRAQDRWTDFRMPHSDAQPNRWQLAATSCKVTVNAALNKMSLLFLTHLAKHFQIQQWMFVGSPEAMWHWGEAGYLPWMRAPVGSLSLARGGGSFLKRGKRAHSEWLLSRRRTLNKFLFSPSFIHFPPVTGFPASFLCSPVPTLCHSLTSSLGVVFFFNVHPFESFSCLKPLCQPIAMGVDSMGSFWVTEPCSKVLCYLMP